MADLLQVSDMSSSAAVPSAVARPAAAGTPGADDFAGAMLHANLSQRTGSAATSPNTTSTTATGTTATSTNATGTNTTSTNATGTPAAQTGTTPMCAAQTAITPPAVGSNGQARDAAMAALPSQRLTTAAGPLSADPAAHASLPGVAEEDSLQPAGTAVVVAPAQSVTDAVATPAVEPAVTDLPSDPSSSAQALVAAQPGATEPAAGASVPVPAMPHRPVNVQPGSGLVTKTSEDSSQSVSTAGHVGQKRSAASVVAGEPAAANTAVLATGAPVPQAAPATDARANNPAPADGTASSDRVAPLQVSATPTAAPALSTAMSAERQATSAVPGQEDISSTVTGGEPPVVLAQGTGGVDVKGQAAFPAKRSRAVAGQVTPASTADAEPLGKSQIASGGDVAAVAPSAPAQVHSVQATSAGAGFIPVLATSQDARHAGSAHAATMDASVTPLQADASLSGASITGGRSAALEVGFHDATLGWLSVRASSDVSGDLHATVAARSGTSLTAVQTMMPSLGNFLQEHNVAVHSVSGAALSGAAVPSASPAAAFASGFSDGQTDAGAGSTFSGRGSSQQSGSDGRQGQRSTVAGAQSAQASTSSEWQTADATLARYTQNERASTVSVRI